MAAFYHRTVIVTAGVHRRLASRLSPRGLTFRHWPGVTPYTFSYEFAGSYVFGKQSPGVMRCGRPMQALAGSPYCELTDAVLPSSLTRVLPITLVLLHLPTCVGFRYGRLYRRSYDAFPGNCFVTRGLVLRPHAPAELRR